MATRFPAARGAARLDSFVGTSLPPSSSSVADIYRETTVCYSYMCPYAYACTEKAARPAKVLTRRCMRYLPETLRVDPGLSDLALDLLARRRARGEPLTAATTTLLDRLRPDGPVRKGHVG